MLGTLLRIVLLIVFVRFVIRLASWMSRPPAPRPPAPGGRPAPPRIVDVEFTEERPGKDRR